MVFVLCIIAGLLLANLISLSSSSKKPQNTQPPPPFYGYDNKLQDYQNPNSPNKNTDRKEAGLHKEREQN